MKKALLTLTFIFSALAITAQTVEYPISKSGKAKTYITKQKDTLKTGNKLRLTLPSNGSNYVFITQGNVPAAAHITGSEVIIKKFKSIGNKNIGFKMYAIFKGFGMIPVYVDIENALLAKEIEIIKD